MKSVQKVFWYKIEKTKDCWNWTGRLDKDGYGISSRGGKTIKAHRYSWVLHFGEIKKEHWVLHKCDNRRCVNPRHLFLGDSRININDMMSKGRSLRGSRNHQSKLTESQVRKIRALAGKEIQSKIARRFGVTQSMISKIILKSKWIHTQ